MESAPIAVLVHEVVVIAGLEMVLVFDDVLVGADGRKSFHLIESTFFQLRIFLKLLHRNDFDRKLPRTAGADGSIDLRKGTLSDFLNEGVVINHFNHLLQSTSKTYLHPALLHHRRNRTWETSHCSARRPSLASIVTVDIWKGRFYMKRVKQRSFSSNSKYLEYSI